MTGITTIPRTYNGEGLAYISPGEAAWLRQMGGGVPTDPQTGQRNQSQQLLGPGNVPSFWGAGGFGSVGSATMGTNVSSPPSLSAGTLGGGGGTVGGPGPSGGQFGTGGGPPSQHYGGPSNLVQRQIQQGVGAAPAVAEEEPEERDTSELEAEIKALTEGAQQRGADRMAAMYALLGWGTPPPQFGSATEGGDQFFTEQVTANQIPAYAALLNDPSVIQALGSSNQAAPTNRPDLRQLVQQRAEEIRTASKGGMINRYDLGGLVNNMLLQAARTRDNIPSNAVS